jgi:hypothetical protein
MGHKWFKIPNIRKHKPSSIDRKGSDARTRCRGCVMPNGEITDLRLWGLDAVEKNVKCRLCPTYVCHMILPPVRRLGCETQEPESLDLGPESHGCLGGFGYARSHRGHNNGASTRVCQGSQARYPTVPTRLPVLPVPLISVSSLSAQSSVLMSSPFLDALTLNPLRLSPPHTALPDVPIPFPLVPAPSCCRLHPGFRWLDVQAALARGTVQGH